MFGAAVLAEAFFTFERLGEDGLLVGRIWSVYHGGLVEVAVEPPFKLSPAEAVEAAKRGRCVLRYGSKRLMLVRDDGRG